MDYLQRLLDTALTPPPALAAPELTPVAKSDSPVFEQDQLLGLEAFAPETAFDGQPPLVPAVGAPAQRRDPPPASEAPRPAPTSAPDFPTALETGQIDVFPPPRPAEPETPAKRDDAPESEAQAPDPPIPFVESEPPPSPEERPVEQAEPTARREAPAMEEPRTHRPHLPRGQPEVRAPQEAAPEPPATAVSDVTPRMKIGNLKTRSTLQEALAEPDEATATPVEVTPRPRPPFEPRNDTAEARPEPAAAPAPRAGTAPVTVESAPERQEPPARKPRPATAAAASIIGPLGDMRAARRLFALGR